MGGSNCGRLGVQLVKLVVMGRIITAAAKKNEDEFKVLGASGDIDDHSGDVDGQIRKIVSEGDDLNYALDDINNDPE